MKPRGVHDCGMILIVESAKNLAAWVRVVVGAPLGVGSQFLDARNAGAIRPHGSGRCGEVEEGRAPPRRASRAIGRLTQGIGLGREASTIDQRSVLKGQAERPPNRPQRGEMEPAAFGVETEGRREPRGINRLGGDFSAAGVLETLIVADESVRLARILALEGEIVLVDDVVEATAKNRGGEGHGLHVKGQGDRSDVKEAGDARGHKQIEIGGAGRQSARPRTVPSARRRGWSARPWAAWSAPSTTAAPTTSMRFGRLFFLHHQAPPYAVLMRFVQSHAFLWFS